jgi:flagellar FliL protein
MAEPKELDANPEPEAEAEAAEAEGGQRPSRKGLLIGVMVVVLVLGGVAGSQVIVPSILGVDGKPETAAASKEHARVSAEAHPSGTIYQIENIIVNPAGEQGNRFLMATVAFELPTPKQEEHLREQDIRVRDRVLSILEAQTMEMLIRPGARDSLKRRLAEAIWPMVPDAEWMEVYLPQFVIQ